MAISGVQIRMARAALAALGAKVGVRELAKAAEIGDPGTITRIESGGGAQSGTLDKLEAALQAEAAKLGREFEFTNGGEPGVRLRRKGS